MESCWNGILTEFMNHFVDIKIYLYLTDVFFLFIQWKLFMKVDMI